MSPPGHYIARPSRVLTHDVVDLRVEQQCKEALVVVPGKEKMRKPADPPPIVRLRVSQHYDPAEEYLCSPFLFLTASLVEVDPQKNGSYKPVGHKELTGQNTTSLHRLKDLGNHDGGFFVFADLSCWTVGTFRFQFSLFDVDKAGGGQSVVFVTSVISDPFKVVCQKDYQGMKESTVLSRSFSDQGVRIRLRKETRSLAGSKRSYDSSPANLAPTLPHGNYGGPVHDRSYGYDTPDQKRSRSGSDYNAYGSASSQYSSAETAQYGLSNAGSSWPSSTQPPFQPIQGSYGLPAPHVQAPVVQPADYQRYHQSDAYPSEPNGSNASFYVNDPRSYAPMSSYQSMLANTQQPSQQFEPRIPRGAYQASSASLLSQNQDYRVSVPHTATQVNMINGEAFANEQIPQEQNIQRYREQYGVQALPVRSSQDYRITAPADTPYAPTTQQELKYTQNNYATAHNRIYAQDTATGDLTNAPLSLDSGMLNRSFAPNQQAVQQAAYDDTNGQDMDGFKGEPAPYPSPHHPSPMS